MFVVYAQLTAQSQTAQPLSLKRLKHAGVVLASIKMDHSRIIAAIRDLEVSLSLSLSALHIFDYRVGVQLSDCCEQDEYFNEDQTHNLLTILLTPEEVTALRQYRQTASTMDPIELVITPPSLSLCVCVSFSDAS
jgi:hypothetical protein